ncbi:MAG: hypothetical protein ABI552_14255, partial [Casimicrobiaceae bacterium]
MAVIGGLVTWTVVATLFNLAIRVSWPDYAAVEKAMAFTPAMMAARLVLGVLASLCAGFAAAWIARGDRRPVYVLAAVLLAFFLPVHYQLWLSFPAWYHATFLVSLVIVTLLGGR